MSIITRAVRTRSLTHPASLLTQAITHARYRTLDRERTFQRSAVILGKTADTQPAAPPTSGATVETDLVDRLVELLRFRSSVKH